MFDFSGIFGVERFKIWCQKVLPTVYDDSLSYMELLCKVLKVLEEYGKGSAEIAEQVVLLNKEVAKAKKDIETLAENAGKTDEQVSANASAITALTGRVDAINRQVASIGGSLVGLRDEFDAKVGGTTAYLGEGVNMEDVPADAVIVGGNGTEEEPYNAFEAGGSKEHGGWVRVGDEVIPESDFKMLEEILRGERSVEKAVMADRVTTIDLSQYNDTDNIPVEFARAIGDESCYAFIVVQSGSVHPACVYYISNEGILTQIAGRVNNTLITTREDLSASEKTIGFYCGKLGYNFPQITVLAFKGNINFFVGEKRTSETLVENSKYLYFGKHLINDENATTLENFSRGANGLTFNQAATLKTFAVGETKTVSGTTNAGSFSTNEFELSEGVYVVSFEGVGEYSSDMFRFTGLLDWVVMDTGYAVISIDPNVSLSCRYNGGGDVILDVIGIERYFNSIGDENVNYTFTLRRLY